MPRRHTNRRGRRILEAPRGSLGCLAGQIFSAVHFAFPAPLETSKRSGNPTISPAHFGSLRAHEASLVEDADLICSNSNKSRYVLSLYFLWSTIPRGVVLHPFDVIAIPWKKILQRLEECKSKSIATLYWQVHDRLNTCTKQNRSLWLQMQILHAWLVLDIETFLLSFKQKLEKRNQRNQTVWASFLRQLGLSLGCPFGPRHCGGYADHAGTRQELSSDGGLHGAKGCAASCFGRRGFWQMAPSAYFCLNSGF